MRKESKALAYGALSAALGVAVLYFGSLMPTARLALLCVSSLGAVLMALRFDRRWALGVYIATAVLAFLLLPDKGVALAYALLPGWYPLVKLRVERLSQPLLRFGAKLLVANVILLPAVLLGKGYFVDMPFQLWQILIGLELVFLLYDHALTQIILLYMRKIAGRI